jgi:hypothetical protein
MDNLLCNVDFEMKMEENRGKIQQPLSVLICSVKMMRECKEEKNLIKISADNDGFRGFSGFLLANLARSLSPVHFHGNIFFFFFPSSALLPGEGIKINILLTLSQEGCNTENCFEKKNLRRRMNQGRNEQNMKTNLIIFHGENEIFRGSCVTSFLNFTIFHFFGCALQARQVSQIAKGHGDNERILLSRFLF